MGAIEDTFRNTGQQLGNLPHIVIGENKPQKKQSSFKAWKKEKSQQNFQRDPIDVKIEKFKKYGLIAAVLLIAGYAGYRIIKFMVFG